MKKALSFMLFLSMAAPVVAMDSLYSSISRPIKGLTNKFSEVVAPKVLESRFLGWGSNVLESCRQNPLKVVGVLLVSYAIYKVGKIALQKALMRVKLDLFEENLKSLVEPLKSDTSVKSLSSDDIYKYIVNMAPDFIKDSNNRFKLEVIEQDVNSFLIPAISCSSGMQSDAKIHHIRIFIKNIKKVYYL